MVKRVKLLIRNWLKKVGEGSPYDFWVYINKRIKYQSVVKYFYELKKEGLIEVAREIENSRHSPIKKKLYRIVKDKENSPKWYV